MVAGRSGQAAQFPGLQKPNIFHVRLRGSFPRTQSCFHRRVSGWELSILTLDVINLWLSRVSFCTDNGNGLAHTPSTSNLCQRSSDLKKKSFDSSKLAADGGEWTAIKYFCEKIVLLLLATIIIKLDLIETEGHFFFIAAQITTKHIKISKNWFLHFLSFIQQSACSKEVVIWNPNRNTCFNSDLSSTYNYSCRSTKLVAKGIFIEFSSLGTLFWLKLWMTILSNSVINLSLSLMD